MKGNQALSASHSNTGSSISSKQYAIAAALAFMGTFNPWPVPLTGLHKFYLRQPLWGGIYFLLGWTQIPRVACAVEGLWYLFQCRRVGLFDIPAKSLSAQDGVLVSQQAHAIATALRELEKLRQEGLVSEHEFEQNRRNLLAKLS